MADADARKHLQRLSPRPHEFALLIEHPDIPETHCRLPEVQLTLAQDDDKVTIAKIEVLQAATIQPPRNAMLKAQKRTP